VWQRGKILAEAVDDLLHVHFPENCALSLLSPVGNGAHVETATGGCQGALGVLASMGRPIASSRCTVQVEGPITWETMQWLKFATKHESQLLKLFVSCVQATVFQIQQSTTCNASHSVQKQLAPWLLEMSNRAETSHLELTHEFLAGMLGANRAKISFATVALQDLGCISIRRGRVEVLDKGRLKAACRECYGSRS
jgi:Crp-like helix-turn-helix domain